MLIEHLRRRGSARIAATLALADLDEFYKAASARLESDPDFAARARARVVLLQGATPRPSRCGTGSSTPAPDTGTSSTRKLGVLLTDDDVVGESFYEELMPVVIERLAASGLLRDVGRGRGGVPAGVHEPRGRPAAAHRSQQGGSVHVRHERPRLRRRPGGAGGGRQARVRRRRAASAAPGDGVRGVGDGRVAGCADRSGARAVRQRPRSRPQDAQEPQRCARSLRGRRRRGHRARDRCRRREEPRASRRSSATRSGGPSASGR